MRAVTIDSDLATLFTFTSRKPRITPIQEVQVRRLNDFRPAAGRAGRGCFGRRSGLDTSFVGASAPKKILGDFLILPSSRLPVPDLRVGFVKRD